MANNKQLHLDVAQLTDVGRKREHNEDNMAYVIPKNAQVMAKKGALFIVADGMGGHAAGEVASEIAVDTVSNEYYGDDSEDITISLLHAIKRANALIHQRAAENMLRSGMGTTCVVAVLRGGRAYIANVGDSRAYLVRNGKVKQVSQDHSWVAEQVRAGLLTEDQARTHAQRNVITRSLGTQADVEVDVFHEQLEEKDFLVLCSDGLSGLVSDDEIRGIVDQSAPQVSVYHLVERANANGGPDNITAIVVSVLEVGSEPPIVRRPAFVGGRASGENTAVIGLPPAMTDTLTPGIYNHNNRIPTDSLRYSSGPLQLSDSITSPVAAPVTRGKRGRLFYISLALLVLLFIVLAGGAGYLYIMHASEANIATTIGDMQGLVAHAQSIAASDPSQALSELATMQKQLHTLQQNSFLTDGQKTTVANLRVQATAATQAAISHYNAQSSITALPCANMSAAARLNAGTTDTQTKANAVVRVPGAKIPTSVMYTLGLENKLYQVQNNSLIPFNFPAPLANAQVLDIAGDGTQLVALLAQTNGNGPTSYSLALLTPGQTTKVHASVPVTSPQIKAGLVPTMITALTPDVFVLLAAPPSSRGSSSTILDYAPPARGSHSSSALSVAAQGNLSFSQNVESMVAFPAHQLFFVLAGGSVQSASLLTSGNQEATNVLLQKAIAQPLPVSAQTFTMATPVPMPAATAEGPNALAIPGVALSRALAVGVVGTVPHLYILDVTLHRVLDLQAAGGANVTPTPTSSAIGGGGVTGSITLQLVRQYASPSLFSLAKSMAFDAQNVQVNVVTQSASSMNVIAFSTGSPNGCT